MGRRQTSHPRPKLGKLLDQHGLRETARETEIDHSRLWRWKNGQGVAFIDDAIKLADYFGVSVDELFKKGKK